MKWTKFYLLILVATTMIACDDENKSEWKQTRLDETLVEGKWCTCKEVDSVVLVFENKTMKEHIYKKDTKAALALFDHGTYELQEQVHTNGEIKWIIDLPEAEKDATGIHPRSFNYKLNGDTLSLAYQSGGYIDFQRVK